ncbi:hypothetical protein MKY51_01895 [Solibacillus sp. FSL R5-0691]|uniref:hypothetical protein n=1 Tax=Solibacillus sp. FSL R5-0691 TaxID=2921653 RepID=UPI0030D55574
MNELLEDVRGLLEGLARLLEDGFDSGQEAFNFFRMRGQEKTGIDFIRTVEQVIRTTPMDIRKCAEDI